MAKKRKTKKVPAREKIKKLIRKKAAKAVKKVARALKRKALPVKPPKEKLLGRVEHFFDRISVAAISVKAPFKVGDVIHIKGHTTDFVQTIDSMQIEHQEVAKVKKGDDIGLKVNDYVRQHDLVYLSSGKELVAKPVQPVKAQTVQQPMFPVLQSPKPVSARPSKSVRTAVPAKPARTNPLPPAEGDPYEDKKFFSF